MDKYNQIGIGAQCSEQAARQLEVHGALSDQTWKIERAEAALGSLLSRLELLFNKSGESNKADSPQPAYSSDLAQVINGHTQRIEAMEARIAAAINRLEI